MSTSKEVNMSFFNKVWTEKHKIVYEFFCTVAPSKGVKSTNQGFCDYLGITSGKLHKWTKGQWPSAEDLEAIHDKLGFSYRWLITGEDEPFEEAPQRAGFVDEELAIARSEVKSLRRHIDDLNDERLDENEKKTELMRHIQELELEIKNVTSKLVIALEENSTLYKEIRQLKEGREGVVPVVSGTDGVVRGVLLNGE